MKEKIYRLIATFFYVGYFPKCPGTAGSLAALPVIWFCPQPGPYLFLLLVFLILGTLASKHQAAAMAEEDPKQVVIDEVAGMMLALFLLPVTWTTLILGFCLFRFFDITKILGIRKLEPIPHGMGIMLDDVLAGIYANIVLRVILHFVL